MSGLPITREPCSTEQQDAIKTAVRHAVGIPFGTYPSRLAVADDAAAFYHFLSDPEIHGPIYNLPRPLNVDTVRSLIDQKLEEREAGIGLLFLRFDEAGEVVGYSDFDIWPKWGAGDLGGAIRKDHQGQRVGVSGAKLTFSWMFETLRLQRIVATGALDNVRTARMLDGLGFERMGEITNKRPDGSARKSNVWEVSSVAWFERHPHEA